MSEEHKDLGQNDFTSQTSCIHIQENTVLERFLKASTTSFSCKGGIVQHTMVSGSLCDHIQTPTTSRSSTNNDTSTKGPSSSFKHIRHSKYTGTDSSANHTKHTCSDTTCFDFTERSLEESSDHCCTRGHYRIVLSATINAVINLISKDSRRTGLDH